jgi:PAS domain S-box-containing protein
MAWSILPDGRVDFVNQRWLDYTGFSKERALEDANGVVHPEDREWLAARWPGDMATGAPFDYELRLRGADGIYRWFLIRTVPLRDDRGTIVKWYGASTEIEDRKRAEEALRMSELDLAQAQRAAEVARSAPGGNGPAPAGSGTDLGLMQGLSPQEKRVLALVAGGRTNKEAASELGLSDKTVKNYLSRIFEKLRVRRRAAAVAMYLRHSWS